MYLCYTPTTANIRKSNIPTQVLRVTLTGKSVSHYQILSKIGEGGMATVYLADDLKHGRRVAMKVMNSDVRASARFQREIEIAAPPWLRFQSSPPSAAANFDSLDLQTNKALQIHPGITPLS